MGAGTEGQPGIQAHDDQAWIGRWLNGGRVNPQALAEGHGLVVIHPGPRPVAIIQSRKARAAHDQFRQLPVQRHQQFQRIALHRKQRLQLQVRPQRRFPGRRFQHRVVLGIGQRLRQRAGSIQRRLDGSVVGGFKSEVQF